MPKSTETRSQLAVASQNSLSPLAGKPAPELKREAIPLLIDNIIDKPEIKILAGRDGALASLSGPFDIDSSPAVRDQLLAAVQAAAPNLVSIDLSAVTHFDSSGVATLIEALRVARSCKTELRLRGLQGRLLRLFELTGLLPLFNGSI